MAKYKEPTYRVIGNHQGYEIRYYEPYLVAEVTVEGSFSSAGKRAFRKLFGFISGNNIPKSMVARTEKSASAKGQTIQMTVPVINTMAEVSGGNIGSYTYQFVMPSHFQLDTLPKPTDSSTVIRQVPARHVAVLRYSGSTGEDRYRRHETLLTNALIRDGVEFAGEPLYARYNGPFTWWFNRRNEIMLPVQLSN